MRMLRELISSPHCADCSYSCLLGRPTSIDLNCVDTLYVNHPRRHHAHVPRPPSNIDIDMLRANPSTLPRPATEPTYGTYLMLRFRLGIIVAKVISSQHRSR